MQKKAIFYSRASTVGTLVTMLSNAIIWNKRTFALYSIHSAILPKTFIKHFLIQNQIRISMSTLKRLPLHFFLHFDKRGHRRQLNLPSRSDV